jgi:DNA polymerase-3 subunit delta'
MSTTSQDLFLDAAAGHRMLGAYLVACNRPLVSRRLINAFLQRLCCKKGGCGVCVDCRKVLEGHVDILRLDAPKVAELRDALTFAAEKPYEAPRKAVVIESADDMTDAAANSLLKTLEEPPADTVFLLSARSVCGVLPTIASRCALVPLMPESNAHSAIAHALAVDDTTSRVLADLSGGFLDEARRIRDDADFLARRDETITQCHKLLMQKNMAISAFADFLESNKELTIPLLGVMQSYLRDILMFMKTQDTGIIANADYTSDICDAAERFTSGAISNMISVILETERRFLFAVNFRLAAEKMLFCILEEKNRWRKS